MIHTQLDSSIRIRVDSNLIIRLGLLRPMEWDAFFIPLPLLLLLLLLLSPPPRLILLWFIFLMRGRVRCPRMWMRIELPHPFNSHFPPPPRFLLLPHLLIFLYHPLPSILLRLLFRLDIRILFPFRFPF